MSVPTLAFGHSLLATSGFEYALQQPLFPGKIILWLLFMLSLITWAIMISKAVTFFRMKRADAEFERQFRKSRQPLQLFERNYTDELSMQGLVYEHGAHEAAFQMLGSPDRDATFGRRLQSADGMTANQLNAVRDAFARGEEAAASRIRLGMPILSAASAGAPFLGLLGMVWILMKTFSSPTASEGLSAVSPGIAGGLAVMVVALLVSTPAIFAQIIFAALGRERLRDVGNFKDDALRLMERFYLTDSGKSAAAATAVGTAAAHTLHREEETEEEIEEAFEPSYAREESAPLGEIDDEQESRFEESDEIESEDVAELPEEAAATADFVEHHGLPEEEEGEAVVPVPIGMIVDDSATNELIQDEMPLSEIESPFEAVEEGFIDSDEETESEEAPAESAGSRSFNTPFAEHEINPIAQQTAGILAGSSA